VNLPRYLIEHELGEAALGHFAAMAYIIVAGNMVVGALAHSAAPRLSRRYVRELTAFKRLVWKLVQFGAALGAAGLLASIFFGRQILTALYKAEYAAHVGVFEWLMAAAAIGYVARFLVCSMTAARFLRAQAPLYALALVVLGVLSFWLIPRWGLLGAAWALTAGMAALLIGAAWVNVMAVRSRAAQGSAVFDFPETQQKELPLRCQ
jgi:O-antigen/teichoic acid export membrane protein